MIFKKEIHIKNYDIELAIYNMPVKLFLIPTIEITWSKEYFNLQIDINIFNICFSFGIDNYDFYYRKAHGADK